MKNSLLSRTVIAKLLFVAAVWCAREMAAADFPAPKNAGDPAKLGLNIQRAMTLLATSTPEHRNTVRVLFYGQSITEQDWWKIVADDLKHRFPNANLIIENRALGGYASQLLVKTAETDLYPFYPDLLIFYVYGAHDQYENIIRRTRERTTAEILIQTDHATADDQQNEETDPAKIQISGKVWNSFMNYKFLPGIVTKYECGMVDQRNLWKQYLKDQNISAPKLLRDGVHLNAHGCYLMAEFAKAYLIHRDDAKLDPMNCATVKTFSAGSPQLAWKDGKLVLEFEGNRIDAVFSEGSGSAATILIDGKKPSKIPELYGFTRALPKPGSKWPAVANLKSNELLQLEDWTLHAKKDAANPKVYSFALSGSLTGPDGEGRSDQKFVSKSGRIVIDPACWDVEFALMLAGVKPAPEEFSASWKVVLHFVDEVTAPLLKDKSIENVVTLAQGLANGKHTIEISGGSGTLISALRVYCPPTK